MGLPIVHNKDEGCLKMQELIQGVVEGAGEKTIYVIIGGDVYKVKEMTKMLNITPEELIEPTKERCKKCSEYITQIQTFPRVFVNKNAGNKGVLDVVYQNRVECYDFRISESKADIDKSNGEECVYDYEDIYGKGWNASHEINMMENNGFKEIIAGKKMSVHVCKKELI